MSLSSIMRRAWQLYRSAHCKYRAEFAEALRAAWAEAKAFETTLRTVAHRCVLYLIIDCQLDVKNPDGATNDDARWVRRNKEAIIERLSRESTWRKWAGIAG